MNPDKLIPIANAYAQLSKDSVKVGAILCDEEGGIISAGFNGFPRGVEDFQERYDAEDIRDRLIVHAEVNALLQAARTGASTQGSTLVVWGRTVCGECAKAAVQAGVIKIIMPRVEPEQSLKWTMHRQWTRIIAAEAQVELIEYPPEAE